MRWWIGARKKSPFRRSIKQTGMLFKVMKIRLRRMSRLLSVAALSVALFSCADEEIVGGGPRVQEGLPAQIVLKVASGDNRIETRAAQDAANEKRVTNLYVFVFDETETYAKGQENITTFLPMVLSLQPDRKTMRRLPALQTSPRLASTLPTSSPWTR